MFTQLNYSYIICRACRIHSPKVFQASFELKRSLFARPPTLVTHVFLLLRENYFPSNSFKIVRRSLQPTCALYFTALHTLELCLLGALCIFYPFFFILYTKGECPFFLDIMAFQFEVRQFASDFFF